jgi:hypothetical protein
VFLSHARSTRLGQGIGCVESCPYLADMTLCPAALTRFASDCDLPRSVGIQIANRGWSATQKRDNWTAPYARMTTGPIEARSPESK